MEITPDLVRELIHYAPRTGAMRWKPRSKHWFKDETYWRRWNNRYANQPAFTYVSGGYRWGSILNRNQLGHRIAWLHVHGEWPQDIAFKNGDGTDLRISNMVDRAQPVPIRRERLPQPRQRMQLAA